MPPAAVRDNTDGLIDGLLTSPSGRGREGPEIGATWPFVTGLVKVGNPPSADHEKRWNDVTFEIRKGQRIAYSRGPSLRSLTP